MGIMLIQDNLWRICVYLHFFIQLGSLDLTSSPMNFLYFHIRVDYFFILDFTLGADLFHYQSLIVYDPYGLVVEGLPVRDFPA